MSKSKLYRLQRDGIEGGPYNLNQLIETPFTDEDLICEVGSEEWRRVENIPILYHFFMKKHESKTIIVLKILIILIAIIVGVLLVLKLTEDSRLLYNIERLTN